MAHDVGIWGVVEAPRFATHRDSANAIALRRWGFCGYSIDIRKRRNICLAIDAYVEHLAQWSRSAFGRIKQDTLCALYVFFALVLRLLGPEHVP